MRFVIGLVTFFLLSSCAHRGHLDFTRNSSESASEEVVDADSEIPVLPEVASYRKTDPKPPEVKDPELAVENVPVEVNQDVRKWINYFQGRGRHHMVKYLGRSTRYADLMKRILRENGLPEDLIYMALIESGFSSQATSHASAVGYWQFIRGTALAYGLKIDPYIDERRDPVLATQAAADYLKALHTLFDSWYLAMAAYNVGENRIKRELMTNYTRDFWVLVKKKRLPAETRNYVPKFIAAKLIGEDPVKYGFTDIPWEPALEFDQITVAHHVDLKGFSKNLNVSYEEIKKLNPKFRTSLAPTEGATVELRVPAGSRDLALVAAANSAVKSKFIAGVDGTMRYRVQRGDTLSGIAGRYRTSVSRLRSLNNMSRRSILRAGSRIHVPSAGGVANASSRTSRSANSDGRYKVRRGDNLTEIARDFNTSVAELRSMNDMRRGSVLAAGRYIQVTAASAAPAVSAQSQIHVVRRGENLGLIARKYGIGVGELQQLNKLGRGSLIHVGQKIRVGGASSQQTAEPQVHVVRRGENLSLIARKYGASVSDLQQWNELNRKSLITVGQRIKVAGSSRNIASPVRKRVHIVRNGDTLIHIAKRYSVPVSELAQMNAISNRARIMVGSELVIPD